MNCEHIDSTHFDVVLVPAFSQADDYRRAHAGAGLFGVTVTTYEAWVSSLWELSGDGRTIVDDTVRLAAMHAVFKDVQHDFLRAPGYVHLAAKIAQAGAGLPEFERALAAPSLETLSKNEISLLKVIANYFDFLTAHGFVEQGSAVAQLASAQDTFSHDSKVLMHNAAPLTWQQQLFFEECDHLHVCVQSALGAEGVIPLPQYTDLSFNFASGRYAQPALIADAIRAHYGEGPIAVTCVDPLELYDSIANVLLQEGINCAVRGRKPFVQTSFGSAYRSMIACLSDVQWRSSLLDVVCSPFSGVDKVTAQNLEARLLINRIAEKESYLATLRADFEEFSQLEELASDPNADILLGVFIDRVLARFDWSESFKTEQINAMDALRKIFDVARAFDLTVQDCIGMLESVSIPCSKQATSVPVGVLIGTQADIAVLEPGSISTLIMADMNNADYPIADKDDAASILFAKLGLYTTDSSLFEARRRFRALQNLPSKNVVVERALHDFEANDTYPCVVLEELIDSYGSAGLSLPQNSFERGEEDLFANATMATSSTIQQIEMYSSTQNQGILSQGRSSVTLLPRYSQWKPYYALSPSQLENYLECPRKWFISNRLKAGTNEETFGPLEKGVFAHEALRRFYKAFQAQGYAKVTSDNLPAARELMKRILDQLEAEQPEMKPGSGRLLACNQLEHHALDAFKKQLVEFLDYEAILLPTFTPRYFEYIIGLPGQSDANCQAMYAGMDLVGKVDRIDVDSRGNAVIIDYKGSTNSAHYITSCNAAHAGKVQTRIYAQAIKQALGLNVVGAFYVDYGKNHSIAGSYDPRFIDAVHLPNIRPDKCACALNDPAEWSPVSYAAQVAVDDQSEESQIDLSTLTFSSMLDATEELVRVAATAMKNGRVEAKPSTGDACRYCPDRSCTKRGV